jgi:DNA replication protein DnaC
MTLAQVRNKMEALSFDGMLPHLEPVLTRLQKGDIDQLEALDTLLEYEWSYRRERATKTRTLRSKIRRGASLEEYDLTLDRGLKKNDLKSLGKLEWLDQGKPLIFVGPTGTGKTYLARALGLLACEKGKTSLFVSVTDFLESQAIARNTNSYLKLRERLVRPDLLIIDDFGTRKFSSQEAEDLRDVIEHRSYGKSTMITTQLPTNHWGEVIGDEIILDALVDRIEPPGLVIKLDGPSYRPELNKKLEKTDTKE